MTESKRTDYMFRSPSVRERDAQPSRMRAEAIAMRRIVAEMGYWLSPLLRDHPVPVLTEWERTVDLTKLDHNHKHRDEAAQRAARKQESNGANSRRKAGYKLETYAELQARVHSQRSKRKPDAPLLTEAEINAVEAQRCLERRRRKKEQQQQQAQQQAADAAAKRTAAIAAIQREAQSISDAERKRLAMERIAAVAAEKARIAAERASMTPEQRAARRKETARKASKAYAERLKADPARYQAAIESRRKRDKVRYRKQAPTAQVETSPVVVAQTRIPNPHRDPTLPTARQLREEAIYAAAIERANRERQAAEAEQRVTRRRALPSESVDR